MPSRGAGLYPFTSEVQSFVRETGLREGSLTVFVQHTSASLTIQENADPDVLADLQRYFERIVPEGDHYLHSAEGPDDMPAHIRSVLTQTSLTIPVLDAEMVLGTWQGIYLFEHRRMPHRRRVVLQLAGTA